MIFGLWLVVATFAATTMTSWHSVALPAHSGSAARGTSHAGSWHLTHFLSADCACSRDVARHLVKRGRLQTAAATEEVVFVASSDISEQNRMREELNGAGFLSTIITTETAASADGVEGVPTLRIEAPDGTMRFNGGYRDRTAKPEDYLDLVILSSLMHSRPVPRPRVYGCATSARLRTLLDPWSLRSLSFPKTDEIANSVSSAH